MLTSDANDVVGSNSSTLSSLIGSSYGKGGMLGQMLLIVPDKRLVVGWHGCGVKAEELTKLASL